MENSYNVKQAIDVSLGWLEGISLVASIVSLAMGGLAIWLSITFYKMSEQSSKEVKQSSNNINNNVSKLEKMFDTMYRDTFGMVKETVSHMRLQADRQISDGRSQVIDQEINTKIKEYIKDISTENISKVEIESMLKEIVKESKQIEEAHKKKELQEAIIRALKGKKQTYESLIPRLFGSQPTKENVELLYLALKDLSETGKITNIFGEENGQEFLVSNDEIRLLNDKD